MKSCMPPSCSANTADTASESTHAMQTVKHRLDVVTLDIGFEKTDFEWNADWVKRHLWKFLQFHVGECVSDKEVSVSKTLVEVTPEVTYQSFEETVDVACHGPDNHAGILKDLRISFDDNIEAALSQGMQTCNAIDF